MPHSIVDAVQPKIIEAQKASENSEDEPPYSNSKDKKIVLEAYSEPHAEPT